MHHARLALNCLTASLLTLPAAQVSAACYTVYDAQGGVVQQADAPPASAAQAASVPAGGRVVLNGDACAREVAMAGQIALVPLTIRRRLDVLPEFPAPAEFKQLAVRFKRVRNIAKQLP